MLVVDDDGRGFDDGHARRPQARRATSACAASPGCSPTPAAPSRSGRPRERHTGRGTVAGMSTCPPTSPPMRAGPHTGVRCAWPSSTTTSSSATGCEQLIGTRDDMELVGHGRQRRRGARSWSRRPQARRGAHGPVDARHGRRGGHAVDRRATTPASQVVVLTSFSEQRRVLEALDAGAEGYLLKHSDPEQILAAIWAAHGGGTPIDPKVNRVLLDAKRIGSSSVELTDREREVLLLVRGGLANKQIARKLGISERTVKAHLTKIFQTLGVTDRTQAALWAAEHLTDEPRRRGRPARVDPAGRSPCPRTGPVTAEQLAQVEALDQAAELARARASYRRASACRRGRAASPRGPTWPRRGTRRPRRPAWPPGRSRAPARPRPGRSPRSRPCAPTTGPCCPDPTC